MGHPPDGIVDYTDLEFTAKNPFAPAELREAAKYLCEHYTGQIRNQS